MVKDHKKNPYVMHKCIIDVFFFSKINKFYDILTLWLSHLTWDLPRSISFDQGVDPLVKDHKKTPYVIHKCIIDGFFFIPNNIIDFKINKFYNILTLGLPHFTWGLPRSTLFDQRVNPLVKDHKRKPICDT